MRPPIRGVGCSDEQSDTNFTLPTTGDIVWLRYGDRVPCEIRLIEAEFYTLANYGFDKGLVGCSS